jgi:uncharacterized LabA/DUF88 family protein
MDLNTSSLNGATAVPLRINFYVDGYHAYKLANAAVELHQSFLREVLAHFPGYERYFDFKPNSRKKAEIVVALLEFAEHLIVAAKEEALAAQGIDILRQDDVRAITNPLFQNIFDSNPPEADGRTFVHSEPYGIVFRPRFNKTKLLAEVNSFYDELRVDERTYGPQMAELRTLRKQLERGGFDESQAFYDALADVIGHSSHRGFLKLQRNVERKVEIGEKGVDGDFVTQLVFDAADKLADVYVLLTNDGDHAPAAERLCQRGNRVAVVTYGNRPSLALRNAVEAGNFLSLLTDEREFDFDPIWLLEENKKGWGILEDMRMQWDYWQSQGLVRSRMQ